MTHRIVPGRIVAALPLLAAAFAGAASPVAAAQAPALRAGYLERPFKPDDARKTIVGAALADLTEAPRDVLADVRKGKVEVAKLDVLVFGSFLHYEPDAASAVLVRERAKLRWFVEQGGVALIMPQAHGRNVLPAELLPEAKSEAERKPWGWLAPEAPSDWAPQHWDVVVDLEPAHPLVARPNRISAERVNAAKTAQATQTDSPIGRPGGRFLLGHRYKLASPWLSEFVVGKGRVVVCGGAIDQPRKDSDGAAEGLFRELVGNVLAYAGSLKDRTAPAFEPTFKALPATTKEAVVDFDDYAGFERRVTAAVDRGVEALRKMQKKDGSFGVFKWGNEPKEFPVGQTCLGVMALLASGVSKHDPAVKDALAYLASTSATNTYDNGLLCLALEHKAAPDGERFEMARLSAADRAKFVYKRVLAPPERAQMEAAAAWLVRARHRGFWRYVETPVNADLSNSQYAALGLMSAQRCGVAIPKEAFEKYVGGLLATQGKGKDRPYAIPRRAVGPREWPEFEMSTRPVGFWDYDAPLKATRGRGTTDAIGIVMLAIGLDALSPDGVRDHRGAKIAASVDAALNHLDAIFRVDVQPSDPDYPVDRHPDFYFLYTLERAMVLINERFVGRHDWYREAAEFLLDVQRADGKWDVAGAQHRTDLVHTSFALLTLRRATVPTRVTPR